MIFLLFTFFNYSCKTWWVDVEVEAVDQWSLIEAEELVKLHQKIWCFHSSLYHHLHHDTPVNNNTTQSKGGFPVYSESDFSGKFIPPLWGQNREEGSARPSMWQGGRLSRGRRVQCLKPWLGLSTQNVLKLNTVHSWVSRPWTHRLLLSDLIFIWLAAGQFVLELDFIL